MYFCVLNKNSHNPSYNSVKKVYLMYLKKQRDDTCHFGFIGGPRFKLCFIQVFFLKRFLARSRLENDHMIYPYCLTISVCRMINKLCWNVLPVHPRQTYLKSNGSLHKSDVNSLYNHWGVPRDKSRESKKKNPRILVYRTLSDLLSDYIMSLLQLSFDHFPN